MNATKVSLIAATLDPDGPYIRRLRYDSGTVFASFDPKRITVDLATRFLRSIYGASVTITSGVTA